MKLFTVEQVKKFFDILDRQDRAICLRYTGYNSKSKDYTRCAREVFVNRTLNKHLKGKKLILYVEDETFNLEYKQYVSITNIEYYLGYGNELEVYLYDYSRPYSIYNSIKIDHNKALRLEGEWTENSELHNKLIKLFVLDLPEKEYVFKAYDWDKYPKRVGKGKEEVAYANMETFITISARTEKEAYKKKEEYFDKLIKEGKRVSILPDIYSINEIPSKQ